MERWTAPPNAQASALLEPLSQAQRARVVKAMATVMASLSAEPPPPGPFLIRQHAPGDIGWIIHRHGALYAAEYGWDETFEGLVAEIAGRFLKSHDPRKERCWVAERDGEIVGSASWSTPARASPSCGCSMSSRRRAASASAAAWSRRRCNSPNRPAIASVTLWTNDVLVAARRIYEAAGFALISSERHHSFGKDLVGENWEKAL